MKKFQLKYVIKRVCFSLPPGGSLFYYKFAKYNYQILIVTRYYIDLCGVKKEAESRLENFPKLDSAPKQNIILFR
jgi:hypothetical protein